VFLDSFVAGLVLGKARRVATVRARVSELVRRYRVRRAALIRRRTDASRRLASPRLASRRAALVESKNARECRASVYTESPIPCLRTFYFLSRWDTPYADGCHVQVQHAHVHSTGRADRYKCMTLFPRAQILVSMCSFSDLVFNPLGLTSASIHPFTFLFDCLTRLMAINKRGK